MRGRRTYQTTKNSTHVEDGPEPSKVATLLVFQGIGEHDGALSSPEETSANTKECTGEDIESRNVSVKRDEQAGSIDSVTNTTKGQGNLDAQTIDKGSTEEGEYGEGTVKGGVLRRTLDTDRSDF